MGIKAKQLIPNELLKIEREERYWSQEELAEKLDLGDVRTIKRWEKGAPIPHPGHCRALEQLFGKSLRALGWADEDDIPYRQIPSARNVFFTGRDAILETLSQRGTAKSQNFPQALTGLAGIGKTQIVTEYAYRYMQKYHTVVMLHANSTSVLFSEFAALATLLGLPQRQETLQGRSIEAVKAWLKKRKHWLLVFDNVDSAETIETILEHLLPLPCLGHVLLTTRLQALGPITQKIEVTPLQGEEAMQLLLRRSKAIALTAPISALAEADYGQASKIVQRLAGLPLALDQAAAYIEETRCSFADYLDKLNSQPGVLLDKRGLYTGGHPEPIATTWFVSFAMIKMRNRVSVELLTLFAFLDPDGIPEDLLLSAGDTLGPILQSLGTHPIELRLALEELFRYSFVRHNTETHMYIVHRLVQWLVQKQYDEQGQKQQAERVVRAINRLFPDGEVSSWDYCQRYLPQAQICAHWIVRYQLLSPEAAQLLDRVGCYLYKRGRYDDANPFLQQALHMREQILGPEHSDTASSLDHLALLYHRQGKYEQAEPLYERALSIREQVLGPEHPDTASSLDHLAGLYGDEGKYEQAEPLYERALAIFEKVLGPEHPDTANSLNSLAVLSANQGKYEQAETCSLRDLAIKEKMLGKEHPDVAESLSNLAGFYHSEGKYAQAEPLYERALAIFEKVLGPEHSFTAAGFDNLAGLYVDQGKYEQAKSLSQRALAISEKVLGPEHPDVSRSLIMLALAYQAQEQYERAEPLYLRALAIYEGAFGTEHPFSGGCLTYLAEVYVKQNRYEQAEAYAQRSLALKEQLLGLEHPSTATSLNILAEIYRAYGKYEQAEALCLRGLWIREKMLDTHHLDIMASLTTLANIYRDEGRALEAEQLEQRIAETRRQMSVARPAPQEAIERV